MSWRRAASLLPVLGVSDFAHGSGFRSPEADVHQRSNHDAHLVPQKPVTHKIDLDFVVFESPDLCPNDVSYRRVGGTASSAKAGEVVTSNQCRQRLLH